MKSLKNQLKSLPKKPGVYIFKNAKGSILYVGKAKNLKSRVSSYFQKSNSLEASKRLMVAQIADLEYIIVDSEIEALFLETTLIKRHHPPYNIIMRDDKYFTYIKINLAEDFPSVSLVRRIAKDKARYFGPYQSAKNVRLTLKHLKKIFPVKTCNNKPEDPCFDFRLHHCAGHLTSPASRREYQTIIKNFIRFLEGRSEGVLTELRRSMSEASKRQQFEKAAETRDRITAIERVLERQKVILQTNDCLDLISLIREQALADINLFAFREGKLISRKNFILKNIQDEKNPILLASFIEQYYTQSTEHPGLVILRELPDRREEIEKLLQLKFKTAERGKLFQLLKLGEANARDALAKSRVEDEASRTQLDQALADLARFLHLAESPRRIETYDISNIQGINAVGSMVVFEAGLPKKSDYRKFKIKAVTGANDPAMLAEILQRRFGHLAENLKNSWPKPDLIILDGGKGQLNIVRDVLAQHRSGAGLAEHRFNIPIAALAKRNEELFLPGKKNPILLPPDSPALFLVQRMRDEAHRFAIGFYRKTHRRQTIISQLDEISGLGPKTKKKLLQKFGSIRGIRQATDQDLINCIGKRLAERVRNTLG